MKPASTYYELLNVSNTATKTQIKNNFYEISKKVHPDHQHQLDAEQNKRNSASDNNAFIKLREAYEILVDEQKRKAYDASLGISSSANKHKSILFTHKNEHSTGFRFNAQSYMYEGVKHDAELARLSYFFSPAAAKKARYAHERRQEFIAKTMQQEKQQVLWQYDCFLLLIFGCVLALCQQAHQ